MKKTYIVKANNIAEARRKAMRMADGDFDLGDRSRLANAKQDLTKALVYARKAKKDIGRLPYDDLTSKKIDAVIEGLEDLLGMISDDEDYQSEYGDR